MRLLLFIAISAIFVVENGSKNVGHNLSGKSNSKAQPRISGTSQKAKLNQFPWMASLTVDGKFLCGAVLIHKEWLLTAAHCVYNITDKRKVKIRLGSLSYASGGEENTVADIQTYRTFDPVTLNHDIALIRLEEIVELDESKKQVMTIKMIPESETCDNNLDTLTISGWGSPNDTGLVSPVLMYDTIKEMKNSECWNDYNLKYVPPTVMCAEGRPDNPASGCKGDDGSPLIKGKLLVGIVSFTPDKCKGLGTKPTRFTRVAHYDDWIVFRTKNFTNT